MTDSGLENVIFDKKQMQYLNVIITENNKHKY